ncbi:MAG: hypothetical protein K8L97_01485 [Anaerolineae bacterium]|nr:hypothetical protein [Anaerolineae bacterium]
MMIEIPKHIMIEMHHDASEPDSCDVIVETESAKIYTAVFITIPYLQRQMQLSYAVSKQIPDTLPVHYAVLETPHVVVENLARETIEDTIDNLMAIDVFESVFTLVTEDESEDATSRTSGAGKRATTEVAAVVISDVLVIEE